MTRRFEGQNVWITGAGSGIGRALALCFAEEGAQVAVSGRRLHRLQEVVEEIERRGGRALAVPVDVTDERSVASGVETVVLHFGSVDVVVANAGFSLAGKVARLTAEDWRRQFDTNVIGVALTAKYALPHLIKRVGRLGIVGSIASLTTVPGYGAYQASKYAVRALGQVLAVELAGTGVSCTLLHPGFVESEIAQVDNQGVHDPTLPDRRPQRWMWPAHRAALVMVSALFRRRREYTFTLYGRFWAFCGQHFPGRVHQLLCLRKKKRRSR
ncbi:MAG: SDR family oxidoreductase [Myxococcales bacterium]|nr:SDR family oxidoreductase [Myxococcales bacterium]